RIPSANTSVASPAGDGPFAEGPSLFRIRLPNRPISARRPGERHDRQGAARPAAGADLNGDLPQRAQAVVEDAHRQDILIGDGVENVIEPDGPRRGRGVSDRAEGL